MHTTRFARLAVPLLTSRFLLARRHLLSLWVASALGNQSAFALAKKRLEFPRDHGAHPEFSTEWWYLTGFINTAVQEAAFGFQVTFFRSRVPQAQALKSDLAARQLVFAHAAVTDVASEKLWHDQRIARSSGAEPGHNPADLASCSTKDMSVVLKNWTLKRNDHTLSTRVVNDVFSLDLTATMGQSLLAHGDQGLSRKGPDPAQASYYYSLPQLQVHGDLSLKGRKIKVETGSAAWLDHEWSQEMLHPQAVGWDWIGLNLDDGNALMAFRLRDESGAALWGGATFRDGASLRTFEQDEVDFKPLRTWRSPASRAIYPVEWAVTTPAGSYTVRSLVDNQELDSRSSTGAIYWEGLCDVLNPLHVRVGRGYLEMTGYSAPIRM
ncbi:MAG: carotenoid 1,2-hydratase [Rhodoferax sp.]|nr:carotenoid 1,2-hydratase [Rhodoferax sp.]MCF8207802.1 carotenoid 1,2-hydratase [Rhodoferax sp.]